MKKFAFLDTETSGLFDFSKPADADGQPRLAHFAMLLTDEAFQKIDVVDALIKPDGWVMNDEAAAIHGLTTDALNATGVPVAFALNNYTAAIDHDHIIVAFNASFDLKVMRGELRRAGVADRYETTPSICVMRPLTDICKIPNPKRKGYKWPTLAEAAAHFDIKNEKAHSAAADAWTALHLFRKLIELKPIDSLIQKAND